MPSLRRSPYGLLLFVVVAVCGWSMTRAASESGPTASPVSLPASFKGKVLVVYELVGETEVHWGLRGARIETVAGKSFLAGTVIPTGEGEVDWQRDLTIRIAWDSVTTLLEFDSEDQYRERMLLEQEQKKET